MSDPTQPGRGFLGRVVHLFGDSIMRGYALGSFDPPASHPLHALRSPASTLGLILGGAGVADVAVRYRGVPIGAAPLAEAAQSVVFPGAIGGLIASGTIRAGDVVVLEDAGPHGSDPLWYADALRSLIDAATAREGVTVLVLTTPSFSPAPAECRWDLPLAEDGRTMNDVVRAVAREPRRAEVLCVEWRDALAKRRASALAIDGADLMRPDGIHPNVLGQLSLCREILHGALLRHRVGHVDGLAELLAANAGALDVGGAVLSPGRVAEYARWLVLE